VHSSAAACGVRSRFLFTSKHPPPQSQTHNQYREHTLQYNVLNITTCPCMGSLVPHVLPSSLTFSHTPTALPTCAPPSPPQAASATRSLLVHLKSTSRDGGLVTHLVEGLTLLYDHAQELHGDEDAVAAAGGDASDAQQQPQLHAFSATFIYLSVMPPEESERTVAPIPYSYLL